jgi:hypothetical protein
MVYTTPTWFTQENGIDEILNLMKKLLYQIIFDMKLKRGLVPSQLDQLRCIRRWGNVSRVYLPHYPHRVTRRCVRCSSGTCGMTTNDLDWQEMRNYAGLNYQERDEENAENTE